MTICVCGKLTKFPLLMDNPPLENRVQTRQLRVRKDPGHRRCLQPTHSRPRRGSRVAPVSDPRLLRMVRLFLLGPMVHEMEMTLENVSIANSGVTLLEIAPTGHFFRLGDLLLEKGKPILLERGRGR